MNPKHAIPLEALSDVLPGKLLAQLALAHHVDKVNQIKLPGQTVFLCLLTCISNHLAVAQRLLEATYEQLTGQTADHSSFGKRLASINPEYFADIFDHVYQKLSPALGPQEHRGLRVRRVDATTVTLSAKMLAFGIHQASGGSAGLDRAKRHVKAVWELSGTGLPRCLHLCREQSEASDNLALGDPMIVATQPGDLWVFDRGMSARGRLLTLHQRHGFFVTPHKDQSLRVLAVVWENPDPAATARAAPPLGAPGGRGPAPSRLLRVERAVFENGTDAQSATKQKRWGAMPLLVLHLERWDARRRQWTPLVLLTNLPLSADGQQAGPYSFGEVMELYRLRWEIETFFKFLKQHLSYAHLLSYTENGIRVLIWMALITALLLIWYKRVTGRQDYWNVIKFWFAEQVRTWTAAQLELDVGRALAAQRA
jgi:hypothetical protein